MPRIMDQAGVPFILKFLVVAGRCAQPVRSAAGASAYGTPVQAAPP
jgi:hypothetical protein